MGNSRSSIYHRPGIHPNLHHTQIKLHYKLERTLQLRLAVLTKHGEQQLPVINRCAIGVNRAPGVAPDGGRDRRKLSFDARKLKKKGRVADTWTFNGKIVVKDNRNNICEIASADDLVRFQ